GEPPHGTPAPAPAIDGVGDPGSGKASAPALGDDLGGAPGFAASGRLVPGAIDPAKDRLSTFSIDVDTASYTFARRSLLEGRLPPPSAVRVEEMLNYFDYRYAEPARGPFAVHLAAAPSPFQRGHHLLRVGIQGRRVATRDRKPVHLVYLVDTSGSM